MLRQTRVNSMMEVHDVNFLPNLKKDVIMYLLFELQHFTTAQIPA